MKTNIIYIFMLFFLVSCVTTPPHVDLCKAFSSPLDQIYFKNTFSYPVYVQSWNVELSDEENWCKQLVPFSEPIEIQPGESKKIMDFVAPQQIRIIRVSDNVVLSVIDNPRDIAGDIESNKILWLSDVNYIPNDEEAYSKDNYPIARFYFSIIDNACQSRSNQITKSDECMLDFSTIAKTILEPNVAAIEEQVQD
jgi:hypothetical protein